MSGTVNDQITAAEARAALDDPVNGSLRVLKALGRQRDLYRAQMESGDFRLVVTNDLEQVAAEAAAEDIRQVMREEGVKMPRIFFVQSRVFEWK
ncbi:MAG: hypothetical protein LBP22_08530 [Deltaproteobacteria bacterium]|jgi:hypothetical protein|nr:hypothetical protein [Deltaproteobacteria bacterium]